MAVNADCGGGYWVCISDPEELFPLAVMGSTTDSFDGRLPYRNVDAITNTIPKTKYLIEKENQEACIKMLATMTRKTTSHTKKQEQAYTEGTKSCRTRYERTVERTMDTAVANPFRMLSAYFITAATTRPPMA